MSLTSAPSPPWALQIALLASLLFWIVAWHWETATSMADIWWRSDTFAHGMIVYPISIWLVWRERERIRNLTIDPAYWVAFLLACACLGWLVGDMGRVQAARQFFLAAMLALTAWAFVGTRISRVIAFPLAFTLLAVPFGEFLLPVLMEHTADFTVGALRVSGIPVYREGNSFVVPSGRWSVVEACSGLRYLIASITLGLLYAYLSYRSMTKRLLFVLASILVPIVANWVRAYMIVMIGHLSGMKYAVGADHLLYGWVFFGLVMLLLFWVGSFWRDDDRAPQSAGHPPAPEDIRVSGQRTIPAALLIAALVTVAPIYSAHVESVAAGAPRTIVLAEPALQWRAIEKDAPLFRPQFRGARSSVERSYERDGRRVGLYIGYYFNEREGAELIGSKNLFVSARTRDWIQVGQRTPVEAGDGFKAIASHLRSVDRDLTAWQTYWISDGWTASPQVVKVRQALNKLMGRGDDAAVVVIYAQQPKNAGEADALLRRFAQEMAPSISASLAQARNAGAAVRVGQPSPGR